jgi:hypothetical protein
VGSKYVPEIPTREHAPLRQHQGLRRGRNDGTPANHQRAPSPVSAEVQASWTQLGSRVELVDQPRRRLLTM